MARLDINVRGVSGEAGAAIAEMVGAIDGTTVDSFQDYLEEILKKGVRKLILDMAGVPYVNSTGLGSLVKYQDRFQSTGGGLALVRVTPKVKIIMETLGLHATLTICKDQKAALKALARAGSGGGSGGGSSAGASASAAPSRSSSGKLKSAGRSRRKPSSAAPSPAPAESSRAPAKRSEGLPQQVDCASCGLLVELESHGNFKCPRCGALIQFGTDGSVRFLEKHEPGPAQLTLTSNRECAEGLILFVGAQCRGLFNGSSGIDSVRNAMKEVLTVLMTKVYPNDPTATYHVSVDRSQHELEVKIADHGQQIDYTQVDKLFSRTQSTASEFEIMPHPRGGNILRIKFRP